MYPIFADRRVRQIAGLLVSLSPLLVLLLALTPAAPAQADNVTVGTGTAASCNMFTLGAVMNTHSDADITFACGGPATVVITQPGGLDVLSGRNFTIAGGDVITISGIDTYRLFNVQTGGALTLTHIVLAHGYAAAGGPLPTQGGALLNNGGQLVLDHTTVRDNQSNFAGGAVETAAGTTTLMDSLVENNQSDYGGGLDSIGTLTLIRTTVRNNHALTNNGGGLDVGGTVVISSSEISGNTDEGAAAGGGLFVTSAGRVTIGDSLIAYNYVTATAVGGGIYSAGVLTLTGVTLNNNATGSGDGAGLFNDTGGQVDISDSGFYLNPGSLGSLVPATHAGGGIFNNVGGLLIIRRTIFSGNEAAGGGGIYNEGGLMLANVNFSGNDAVHGGGLLSKSAATLTDVSFVTNPASAEGGGISNSGNLTLTNVTFNANSASSGGGINNTGIVTLTNATLSGNTATAGGGINNTGAVTLIDVSLNDNPASSEGGGINNTGIVTLTGVTLNGNTAIQGGGINNAAALSKASLSNSTLSSNSALSGGGGVLNLGVAVFSNDTFYGNTAPNGGAIYQSGGAGQSSSLENTIVANSPAGGNCYRDPGSASGNTILSFGYNLSSDTSCQAYFNKMEDLPLATDPNLGPLANNGGPTLTHLPLTPDSPGIDVIPKFTNGCGTTLITDQRGAPRPIHGKCDIGAVEYGATFPWLWLPLVRR